MRHPLFGLIGLGFGLIGCLIFVALLLLAGQFTWINPQAVVVMVIILEFFALVLGICSIGSIPGKLSASLGALMLVGLLVIFPAWTTASPIAPEPSIEVQQPTESPD